MSRWHVAFDYRARDEGQGSGDFTLALRHDWTARVTGVFGPSGSGKTTLLEILLGLRGRHRLQGRVELDGRMLFDTKAGVFMPARERRFGWVPQDGGLFPHLTVRENLRFGISGGLDGRAAVEFATVVDRLELDSLASRMPHELSGGERQRVALGRALLLGAQTLLLDEPLASLDLVRRKTLLEHIKDVARSMPVSMLYISHDWNEVVELCDHALVLAQGRLVAAGDPATLTPY